MRNVPKTEPSVCDSWQYFTLSPLVYLTLFGGYRLSLGLFNDKESYVQSYLLPDPTHLTPTFFFFANKCTLYSSLIAAAVELSLSENKLGFFGLTRTFFCFAASAFLSVDIKGFQKSFDIALFFFSLHSSAAMQLHFPKQDLCWRTALSVFFCQGPSLLKIHCLTLSDPAVVTGFTTRSLVVLQGEVSQDEQVTDR